MGDGTFPACQRKFSNNDTGCQRCCTVGSFLFPGEKELLCENKSEAEWNAIGVKFFHDRIEGCMRRTDNGGKICQMAEHGAKTLNCKLYPRISWSGLSNSSSVNLSKTSYGCPAARSCGGAWGNNVKAVKKILRREFGGDIIKHELSPAERIAALLRMPTK